MTPTDLRAFRAEHHLTQPQLAAALGVHPRTVAAWEAERQAIPAFLERAVRDLERERAEAAARERYYASRAEFYGLNDEPSA